MNTLVSFPIAKLLKEKGFYEPCLKCYLENGSVQISSGDEGDFDNYNHNQWDNYSAPTIAEVVMWLYKNHGIWISVECDVYGKLWYAKSTVASKSLWENEDKRHEILTSFRKFPNEHDTPTKAYEAAIEYTLNNSIWHKKK